MSGLVEPIQRGAKFENKPALPFRFESSHSGIEAQVLAEESLEEEEVSNVHELMKRNFERYDKRLEVKIFSDGKVFQTFSKDISVGGLLLETPLPDWIFGYFKVRLSRVESKKRLELTACLVENQDPHARLRLAFLPLQNKKDETLFEQWIQSS